MGARARLVIAVDDGDAPLFVRIARSIADDARRGRIRAGDPLPGTRALADSLGVNRNTVVAAYRELEAEGWIVATPGGGTFIAESLPIVRGRRFLHDRAAARMAESPAFPTRAGGSPLAPNLAPNVLAMGHGTPDPRLFPSTVFARALRRALTGQDATRLVDYGDPCGDPKLRAAVAGLVREMRGVPATADNVIITQGSQMALELTARALCPSGDFVAVESPGYPAAWTAFQRAGASLLPVPVDGSGLDVEALSERIERRPVRAVYVTPHHHYPTTVTMTAARRLALLDLARRKRFAVVEDDYDHELHYASRPVLPLASADAHGSVVYIGTLSKAFAAGIRLGYVVAPKPLVDLLARDRRSVDRQGNHWVERAAAELLEDGTIARHVRKIRRVYASRRDFLVDELSRAFGSRIAVRPPPGGMALWVRVSRRLGDVRAWQRRSLSEGVAFAVGSQYTLDGRPLPFARFGFASLHEKELREGVRRLVRALPP